MATQYPPPSKRRRLEAEEKARTQQDEAPPPEGSVLVRFVDQQTGHQVGDPIRVPLAQSSTKNLNLILNSLKGIDDPRERLPHQFFIRKAADPGAQAKALGEGGDIYSSLFAKDTGASTEDEIILDYAPQAVFRVRAVSRLSSSIAGHGQPILAAQFSPATSSRLATGSGDGTARIWDCDTGTPLATLKGHTSWVLAIAWSPDGDILATGSNDNTVRLWDKQGKPLGNAMKGHTKFVRSLSWEPFHLQAPGRPRVASASKDATVRIWDAINRRLDMVLTGHKDSVSCVRWGGAGFIYTASNDRTIKIWKAENGTLAHSLSSHSHWVNHLALSTDFVIRTAYHDHTGEVPNSDDDKRRKALKRFNEAATIDGKITERLVSASDDSTIFLWSPLHTLKPLARLQGHQKLVNHVTFSPDGLYIASAAFDNSVRLWSARDGKWLATLRGHVAPVYQCCFSADSRLLVSCSKDTTLKVWDVAKAALKEDLPGHQDEVFAVDWAPDGEKVGSGGKDKAVRIWRG